jgi:hypothetical protein
MGWSSAPEVSAAAARRCLLEASAGAPLKGPHRGLKTAAELPRVVAGATHMHGACGSRRQDE